MFSEEHTSKFHVRKTLIKKISFTFHAYRNFIFVCFFFLLSIILLLTTYTDTPFTRKVRSLTADATTPVMEVILIPFDAFESFKNHVRDWGLTYSRLRVLEKENQELKSLKPLLNSLQRENNELRKLLNVKDGQAKSFTTARVITYPGAPFAKSILVSSGTKDGITPQQPVVTERGLVGRTLDVGHFSTRILLLTDFNSKIPVLIRSADEHAILVGDNDNPPYLRYYPKNTKIKPGDLVETSGIGGLFPAGIPVGKVAEIGDEKISIKPFVTLDSLSFVSITLPAPDTQFLRVS
ncbi:MAG: rod shape-determining protein MreC [Alphaproteobacteria bacterium]